MKNSFKEKVIRNGIVDTRKYRYVLNVCQNAYQQWGEIRRISLDALDTTEALKGWQLVERIG